MRGQLLDPHGEEARSAVSNHEASMSAKLFENRIRTPPHGRPGEGRDDGEGSASPHLRFALPGNGNATPVLISFKIMLVRT
jgi:hypothetical protein